jgi:hypothetical protein
MNCAPKVKLFYLQDLKNCFMFDFDQTLFPSESNNQKIKVAFYLSKELCIKDRALQNSLNKILPEFSKSKNENVFF